MAYVVPIHRPSSVRHALKLNLLSVSEECIVLAKANRLEIWLLTPDGLSMAHSKSIFGNISMLQKLRPSAVTGCPLTDRLFVGTDRFQYFTVVWNPETRQLDTMQSFVDVSEKHMRDSQSLDRCLVDPTGSYLVLELFEGVLNFTKLLKPRKGTAEQLEEPQQVRISELFVRASTFLFTELKQPKLALLYRDKEQIDSVGLATYRITDDKGQYSQFDAVKDRENQLNDLDPGATILIPVQKGQEEQKRYIHRNPATAKAQLGGLIVVGETRILYLDDESKATVEYAIDEASIFVAWAEYDNLRYLLADDYGWLWVLTLLVDGVVVTGMEARKIGEISKASAMVYLGNDILYVGSHEGDSQVVQLDFMGYSLDILQVLPNIAPVLDFTIMDMGNRTSDRQTNEYSTGQARIVTGSGAYKTGTLRSVRSGVGLEDIGILGDITNVRAMFSLRSSKSRYVDTLVVSLLTETRIFRFDEQGEVEEVENFIGMDFMQPTLLATNISDDRILQITASRVALLDTGSGATVSSWQAPNGEGIIAASSNTDFVLLSTNGHSLVSLDLRGGLTQIARQDLGINDQVACIYVPNGHVAGIVGFWQSGSVSLLEISSLRLLHGETVRVEDTAAVPRNIVLAQILPEAISGPTLLIAMSNGTVLTFSVNRSTYALSGKKSIILGVQQPKLEIISRGNGQYNVFAICEHSSLIYESEGRIVYSAVTAEDATCICPFNSDVYPNCVAIATASEIKISQIDTQKRTHVRTLPVGETVRRITYSASEKVFGLGCIKKELIKGEEVISCSFRLVDEVIFAELGKPFCFQTINGYELVESVIRAELPDSRGQLAERFIVGTGYLDEDETSHKTGRIRVFGINKNRSPYEIVNHVVKGACRHLAVLDDMIVAGLIKSVVIYKYKEVSSTSASLEKIASYRTSTAPMDLDITGNIIAVADLMKAISLVEYIPGKLGEESELIEVARHFQNCRSTAVSHIENNTYLETDDEGNLVVLRRNIEGITLEDRQRLEVTSEMNLGEMVNRIRKVDVQITPNASVIPRAFLGTTEGSIYLFGTIVQSAQDLLMRLQLRIADLIQSPGQLSFNKWRSFKNEDRETEEPFRFVDGELIERFLDMGEMLQEDVCRGLGPGMEAVRNLVEEMKRLH